MRSRNRAPYLRTGLIIVGLLAIIGGGIYLGTNQAAPAVPLDVAIPVSVTPTPTITPTATPNAVANDVPTVEASPTATATATPRTALPPGGIIYALAPDINSVGWVQSNETGNHFGESFMYTGVREGVTTHGAMQFDLSFIPSGSTIFLAELELTGLVDQGLTQDSAFNLHILGEEVDAGWSRHGFATIDEAFVYDSLQSDLQAPDLAVGRTNKVLFNAAQRSLIEERLPTELISFRLDSLTSEGWFSWDSGYGPESLGQGPVLNLGVLLPPEVEAAEAPPDSTPTPTATYVLITTTPEPENVLTAAAVAPALTAAATTTGTPTELPDNWVTPIAVTNTPTPENTATAEYLRAIAVAEVVAFGTSTPTPANMVTASPTPTETATPVFILLDGELPPMAEPDPSIEITPGPTPPIPAVLIGKIAFKSNRTGDTRFYVINPDGSGLALLTNPWPYNMAELADTFSPDGRFRLFTKDTTRYSQTGSGDLTAAVKETVPNVFWRDAHYEVEEQLTNFGIGLAYGGVWSPANEQIAFVSNDSADDEIWVVNRDGANLVRLTETNEASNALEIGKDTFVPEINKHPSWSPDGKQIVFWSSRTGHGQIWVMNADGSNLYSLSRTGSDDWDPVWIKYPGLAEDTLEKHAPYIGPYELFGPDRNCGNFPDSPPHESAQSFYWAAGGPARDLHELDDNNDGIACN